MKVKQHVFYCVTNTNSQKCGTKPVDAPSNMDLLLLTVMLFAQSLFSHGSTANTPTTVQSTSWPFHL